MTSTNAGAQPVAADVDDTLTPADETGGAQEAGRGEDGAAAQAARPGPYVPEAAQTYLSVLVYSDDVDTREKVKLAIGRRPAADLPPVRWTECATEPAVIAAVDAGGLDVLVLDGESTPAGGMGVCKQLKDEIYQCPPVLVLTGRAQDAWLATWSRADLVVPHPLDPVALVGAVADLARRRLG